MGSRYGVKIRKQEGKVKAGLKAKGTCPSCGKKKVKRQSLGIFRCTSCLAVFSGGAYSPQSAAAVAAQKQSASKEKPKAED